MSIPTLPKAQSRDVSNRKTNDFSIYSPSAKHLGFMQLHKALPQEVAEKVVAILEDAKLECRYIDGTSTVAKAEDFGM